MAMTMPWRKRSALAVAGWALLLTLGPSGPQPAAAEETPRALHATGRDPGQEAAERGTVVACHGVVDSAGDVVFRLRPGEELAELLCHDGEEVAQGQPLMRLTLPALEAEALVLQDRLTQLRSDVAAAEVAEAAVVAAELERMAARKARLEQKRAREIELGTRLPEYPTEARVEELTDSLAECQGEIDVLSARLKAARARIPFLTELVAATERRLASLAELRANRVVKAPFAGQVAEAAADPARAAAGDALFVLHGGAAPVVTATVWQNQILRVQPGSPAQVLPDFLDDPAVGGRVESIGQPQEISADTLPAFPVKIRLDSRPPWLRVGLSVSVSIEAGSLAPVVEGK